MLEAIEKMRKAQKELSDAMNAMAPIIERYNNIFRGKLSDLTKLPMLYEWYQGTTARHGFNSDARNNNHKQFVYVILMLYSPASLFGGKISRELRTEIASLLRLKSPTILYHMRDRSVVWMRTYKAFASEVNIAYEEITALLKENGLIQP